MVGEGVEHCFSVMVNRVSRCILISAKHDTCNVHFGILGRMLGTKTLLKTQIKDNGISYGCKKGNANEWCISN